VKWAIGLDLRREGQGALAWVKWLRDRSAADAFAAVHVLEVSPLLQALRDRDDGIDAVELAREAAQQEIASAGLTGIDGPIVIEGGGRDEALAEAIGALGADGLVIGRRAESNDARLMRLGPVARKLLRRLPVPIVVAPPDLQPSSIGGGPIILATDLTDDSLAAAAFAKRMADTYGCPLASMYVVAGSDAASMYVPAATVQQLYEQLGLDRHKDLEGWNRAAGLGEIPSIITAGDIIAHIVSVADNERAPLIVTGSRMQTPLARVFTASVGTALASHAKCAVAVVPPTQ
jgi:nucleotide-binding universal stress UspA family protein